MRNQDLSRLPETWQNVHSGQYQNQHYQDQGQEQIEELQNKLKTYEIHESNWVYYFSEPKQWDFNLEDESGLCNGTGAVLLDSALCFPIWVHKDSEQRFKLLRAKVTQLLSVHDQVKEFKEAPEPNENFFKSILLALLICQVICLLRLLVKCCESISCLDKRLFQV